MKIQRKSKPWRVVFLGDDASDTKDFTSEPKAFTAVAGECELINDGTSSMERAVVYQWNKIRARWMTYERIDLKKMAVEAIAFREAKLGQGAASFDEGDQVQAEAAAVRVTKVPAAPTKKTAVRKPRKPKGQDFS